MAGFHNIDIFRTLGQRCKGKRIDQHVVATFVVGKLRPIIFDPSFNAYRVVGEVVGKAFSDGLKLK